MFLFLCVCARLFLFQPALLAGLPVRRFAYGVRMPSVFLFLRVCVCVWAALPLPTCSLGKETQTPRVLFCLWRARAFRAPVSVCVRLFLF